ncbi:cation-translocating P-type ATPase [Acidocella sp. KAb 2-4]|uniref:cation-translocating P-type ATPase n=1 Tax=Acidocella sp. KAb 2-4 TaxID=2885158 RepID=UPI001D08E8C2|nr:cation-translocating P-type ATPase [Acidocella sp. KAb 2-4]MCB5944953.1 cation-translocating P-type ATPase [Acidocella sp. KAb 2-4]
MPVDASEQTIRRQGVSTAEAAARLGRDGPNELPQDQRRRLPRITWDAVREPMLQLLLAAGFIYLLLGNLAEALILLGFAVLNVVMVVVQETRTESALAALRELASPQALVWRDGSQRRIAARDLVVGDIVCLAEGERVPADSMLLEATNLQADEALLTGESVPVRKRPGAGQAAEDLPGGEDSPFVWAGSLITSGTGTARVTATGPRTAIGRIGKSLGSVEAAPPPLQVQMRSLVWLFATAGIGSSLLLAVSYGLLHGQWLQAVLAGITLAMATLPEEFPLVLTIFLVLGAWRMSRQHVLARRAAAIEALGTATLLCTDKTGTLTQNRMSVARLAVAGESLAVTETTGTIPEVFHELAEFSILASRPDPFDPMEQAFHRLGKQGLANTEHLHADWVLEHDYPLTPDMLAMSQVWRGSAGGIYVIAAKGAPEAVADLCHLDDAALAALRRDVMEMASAGLRVLAVAKGVHAGPGWPENQHDFNFIFLGLTGLADPLRPGVPEAVAACRGAGIGVAMITGDHPVTALAIARQAGIDAERVLSGQDMAAMDDPGLQKVISDTRVFARIMPEQKLRLVQAFAANGEVVAMTGDGVNDAPSLKAAHIGVAMGGRGTDVAREAASLVLLDDDFTSLVAAIRLGRRIDANLRKAFSYILAVHVPIAGMSLIPVLLGWPLLLGPVHVVFLEMIIDPASSIVFEADEASVDIMSRPPRSPGMPLFSLGLLAGGLSQGVTVLAASLLVFLLGTHTAGGESTGRAMAFIALVVGNLGLVLSNKMLDGQTLAALRRPNRTLIVVSVGAVGALSLALAVPELRHLFGFSPLPLGGVVTAIIAGLASLAVNAAAIRVQRRLSRS